MHSPGKKSIEISLWETNPIEPLKFWGGQPLLITTYHACNTYILYTFKKNCKWKQLLQHTIIITIGFNACSLLDERRYVLREKWCDSISTIQIGCSIFYKNSHKSSFKNYEMQTDRNWYWTKHVKLKEKWLFAYKTHT